SLVDWFRKLQCQMSRAKYRYSYEHVPDLAVLDKLHWSDEPKLEWLKVVAARGEFLFKNQLHVAEDEIQRQAAHQKLKALAEAKEAELIFRRVIYEVLRMEGLGVSDSYHAKSMSDYESIFRGIPLPRVANNYRCDIEFGLKRLMGANPVMIHHVSKLPDKFPVQEEHFQKAISALVSKIVSDSNGQSTKVDLHTHQDTAWIAKGSSDSLERAADEGRLFMLDYVDFVGAEQGTFPHGKKYLYAPMALFVSAPGGGPLLPIAIQCEQTPSKSFPIFTPADGIAWLMAKSIIDTADGNYHEAGTHLGKTHLVMEPFVLASLRNLAWRHPLTQLLAPHFEGTLAINDMAWRHLIADTGAVDRLMGGSIATSRGLAVKTVQEMSIRDSMLPMSFAARGVADQERLPNYAYRDDAQLYWESIFKWVSDYLDLYYKNDQDVQSDFELKAWLIELNSKDGGRLRGLPSPQELTKSTLTQLVTFVIYTCSVQHAAVNFPQYDQMSYVPNMPLAGYRPAPVSTDEQLTEEDYFAMLPPMDMVELQMNLGYLLGTVHYTQLGQYAQGHFKDPRVKEPLERFQNQLKHIGRLIQERNKTRSVYETLLPQGIPQSINI
ncbi:MAG: lipoxygenase family protein, partial [Pirellula sp.]